VAPRKELPTPSALPSISTCLALSGIAGGAKYLGFPSLTTFCAASGGWWRPHFMQKEDHSVVFSGVLKKGGTKKSLVSFGGYL